MIALLILLNVYFVTFTDKPEKTAPQLSERAWEQREKWNIPTDEMDYPVSTMYLDSIQKLGAKIFHKSRWFNGATVELTETQAKKISDLGFVTAVEMTRDNSLSSGSRWAPWRVQKHVDEHQSNNFTDDQLALYNLTPLLEKGYKGKGILMTVCDGGFWNADKVSFFRKAQEVGHFDFTDDEDDFYGSTGEHGTECLSTISGIIEGYNGAAIEADYYLMRSEEEQTESPKEMDNLVAALEKADSLGVNVFSISLGYALFDNHSWDLPKSALDGKTTRVSRAATIAARKGMLVCVAAGNEGDDSWHTISAPADADSILTVGAVDIDGNIGSFSSYGPSADGRVKPEVCAVGVQATLINHSGSIVNSNGTSFATPLLAGLAASLWSALPKENAMQIRERIIRSADRYTKPDMNQYGYGIPDAWEAYQMELPAGNETVEPESVSCHKVLRGGQVIIIRNNQEYTVTGQRIR